MRELIRLASAKAGIPVQQVMAGGPFGKPMLRRDHWERVFLDEPLDLKGEEQAWVVEQAAIEILRVWNEKHHHQP